MMLFNWRPLVCLEENSSIKFYIKVFPVAQTVEFACNAGDLGLIPGSGRSSGEGNGNPLQYSCLENSIHSNILAWRIPWTEETGRLPSMGSQGVGHNWANNTKLYIIHTHTHADIHTCTCAHTLLNSEFFFLFSPQTAVSRRASPVLHFWLWTLAVMKLLCCV